MNPQSHQWLVNTPTRARSWLGTGALLLAIVLVLQWSAEGAQLSWGELANGCHRSATSLAARYRQT